MSFREKGSCRYTVIFTPDQEREFLESCDDWQLPMFLTLLFTGLRPGELTHLLLPEDLDLDSGWLHVRNKPELGWQVKTRNERAVPLVPPLSDVLRLALAGRATGPVFRQRRCTDRHEPPLTSYSRSLLVQEVSLRTQRHEAETATSLSRDDRARIIRTVWRDLGAIKPDMIRNEFMHITSRLGLKQVTAPKTLRHTFATTLQDANVDPLVRNELMGHVPAAASGPGNGLGMTSVYTHTRPETKRRQLEDALANQPAVEVARRWIANARSRSS